MSCPWVAGATSASLKDAIERELHEVKQDLTRRPSSSSEDARAIFEDSTVDKKTFHKDVSAARLATWQILYCGGAQRVVDALKAISEDHGLCFRKEKFDW